MKMFEKNKISFSEVIETSNQAQSKIACSSICLNDNNCEGFNFENKVCNTLKNMKIDATENLKDAWIDTSK